MQQNYALAAPNLTDLGYRDASDSLRDGLVARSREKQFVVFAAVQRESQIDLAGGLRNAGERYGLGLNLRPHAAFVADMTEVGGKAIAKVDHGGGQAFPAQELSDCDPGLRAKVLAVIGGTKLASGEQQFQGGCGATELTRHVDTVTRLCSGAQYGLLLRGGADHRNICQNSAGGLGNVATRKGHLKSVGQPEQARQKAVNPALWQTLGQGKGEKGGDGPATHGSYVAQSPGKTTMADYFGSMPLPPEVDPLQTEIGGYEHFVAVRDAQGGAIVADAEAHCGPTLRAEPNPFDDRLFAERQANSIYKRQAQSGSAQAGRQVPERPGNRPGGYPTPGR